MTDRAALYAAVCANPDDDTVRLAFADWFEENGDPKRAAFVRAQVAFQAAHDADTLAAALFRHFTYEFHTAESLDWAAIDPEVATAYAALRRVNRARARLSAKAEGLPKLKGVEFQQHRRGFFHHMVVEDGEVFARHAAAIFRAAPITDVEFGELTEHGARAVAASGYLDRVRWLATRYELEPEALRVLGRHPDAAGVRELHVDGTEQPEERLAALAVGRRWTGLRKLELLDFDEGFGDDTDAAAAEVFRKKTFRGLEEISAWACDLGDETAVLAAGPFPALRTLDVSINNISTAGGEALAAAKGMPALRHLKLGSNDIRGGEVLAGLIAAPHFPELAVLQLDGNKARVPGPKGWPKTSRGPTLRYLQLDGNTLGGPGAAALAACPAVRGLWALDVSDCDLTDRGLRALAAANLDRLVALHLRANPISGEAVAELVNRPAAAALQWLDLYGLKLGTAGVNALVRSEHLTRLKHLSVTGRGLIKLVKRFGRKVVT